jgi:hypothetical protein
MKNISPSRVFPPEVLPICYVFCFFFFPHMMSSKCQSSIVNANDAFLIKFKRLLLQREPYLPYILLPSDSTKKQYNSISKKSKIPPAAIDLQSKNGMTHFIPFFPNITFFFYILKAKTLPFSFTTEKVSTSYNIACHSYILFAIQK